MSDVTEAGRRAIAEIAARHNQPEHVVEALARAVANGGGTMAQFDIPELGGSGQWMAGGMTMVGDMFNYGLQNTVASLCVELSNAMTTTVFFQAPKPLGQAAGRAGGTWWPSELGSPSSVGGQNQTRYAYFPDARRLAVDPGDGSPITILDTLDHQIGGFSQQQQGGYGDPFGGVSFSSQYGTFPISSLPRVSGPGPAPTRAMEPPAKPEAPTAAPAAPTTPTPAAPGEEAPAAPGSPDADALLDMLRKLGELRDAGVLTDEEFAAKKAEILSRL